MEFLKFYLKNGLMFLVTISVILMVEKASAAYTTPAHTLISEGHSLQVHTLKRHETAEPVIIIGGGPGFSAWNLEPIQFSLFSRGYTSSLMDVAGVGENKPTQHSHWVNGWTTDFLNLIQSHSSPVTLIGHSWGSLMALHLAKTAPELIKKVVLINPVDPQLKSLEGIFEVIDQRWQAHSKPTEIWDNAQLEPESDQQAKLNIIRRTVPAYFYDFKRGQRYAKLFSENDIEPAINSKAWEEYRNAPIQADQFSRFTGSIHIIACTEDPLMPHSLQGLKAFFPHAKSTQIQACGHFPWVENPREFEQALYQHLNH